MKDNYKTIRGQAEGEYKAKGSKFHSYIYQVRTIDEVKSHLAELKKEHFKSRHICYAYRIGMEGTEYRANDDGEPSGTAGLPILNALKSKELVNTLAAVVRYFGGTKLGVAGLISAYKGATFDALEKANIVTEYVYTKIRVDFDYADLGVLHSAIAASTFKIISQDYENEPHFILAIKKSDYKHNLKLILSKVLGYELSSLEDLTELPIKITELGDFEGD